MSVNYEKKEYHYSFDAIKGIVILLTVVLGHYWQFTPGEYWSEGNNAILTGLSNSATQLSFQTYSLMELLLMISGFQMWSQYEKIAGGKVGFGKYVLHRGKRLLPMSIVTTIVMVIGLLIYQQMTGEIWHDMTVSWKNVMENCLGIQVWLRTEHSLNGPLWYVSVYWLCLLLYYPLVRLESLLFQGKRYGRYWLMILPIAFGVYGSKYYVMKPFWNPELCRGYMGFFTGVFCAALSDKISVYLRKWRGKTALHLAPAACCIAVITLYIFTDYRSDMIGISSSFAYSVMVTLAFLYAPLLILLANYSLPDRILGNKMLAGLGKVSFDIYVWNFPFCLWITIIDKIFHLGIPFPMWYMLWVQCAIQIGLGILSYRFISSPLNKWLNQRGNRKQNR